MNPTSVVYRNVEIGEGSVVEEFCIIGKPPAGKADGELRTVIGPGAVIRSHTVIYAGNEIGPGFSTGHHACIRESNRIGAKVSIGTLACVEHHVEIGDGVRIHSQAFVPEYTVLEDGSWIGPKATFTNARYPRSAKAKERLLGPRVGKDAKVGANATILPGVKIGARALVGAGSVLVKDVPEGKIVVGNPARVIGDVDDIEDYQERG
jgi:acetyltransferase-like isoleucine patch superfamily enzyme